MLPYQVQSRRSFFSAGLINVAGMAFAVAIAAILGLSPACHATTWCVNAEIGDDANPGSQDQPWKTIAKASMTIAPGDTVIVMPGLYEEDTYRFGPAGKDAEHRTTYKVGSVNFDLAKVDPDKPPAVRAVLTTRDWQSPNGQMLPNTRIDGLWLGGWPSRKGALFAVNNEGLEVVNCAFFGQGYQLGTGNTARNVLIRDCLFVHMGGKWLFHAIYLAGGPSPTTQDIRVVGNVFIDGEGYALHGWHNPRNLTMVANFVSGHQCSMAAQGPGHVIHHNVFWKPFGKLTMRPWPENWNWCCILPNDVDRFDHNLLWSTQPGTKDGKSLADPVENYTTTKANPSAMQMNLKQITGDMIKQTISWMPHNETEIDEAATWISYYFRTLDTKDLSQDITDRLQKRLSVVKVRYTPVTEDLSPRPYVAQPKQ